MLLHDSRRAARASPAGDLVLLEDQDRGLWNRDYIKEGTALVQRALGRRVRSVLTPSRQRSPPCTPMQPPPQLRIGVRSSPCTICWLRAEPSPVIELNRAVAVAMRDGPATGLKLIDAILARGDLENYHLAHAARADLCRRLGQTGAARVSYQRALGLTQQAPERRFLERRLEELKK